MCGWMYAYINISVSRFFSVFLEEIKNNVSKLRASGWVCTICMTRQLLQTGDRSDEALCDSKIRGQIKWGQCY